MKKLKFLFSGLMVVAVVGFGVSPCLFAQVEDFMLEEITVTAQKREENQQKVATAMEVISGVDLKETARNDVNEILSNVSSVIVNKSTDGLRVSIRGVVQDGNPFSGLQTETPTVALNTDGVYSNRNSGGQNLFDIERVEVLYGPQSTLYASASPGGIVNIITADPKLGEFEGYSTFEFGNYDLTHVEAVVNAPMGDKLALRAGFTSSLRDGYLSNGGEDEDSRVTRLKVKYEPSEKVSLVVTGEQQRMKGQGILGVDAFVDQDDADDPWTSEDPPQPEKSTNKDQLYARMDIDLGFGNMSIVPSWSEKDFDVSTSTSDDLDGPYLPGTEEGLLETFNAGVSTEKGLEVRITSSGDAALKWIVGANYYSSKDENWNEEYGEGALQFIGYKFSEVETKVLYGNITYPITDRVRLNAGMRYSWDENAVYNIETNYLWNGVEVVEGATQVYEDPDYKLGVEYDLGDDRMLYADYSTSFRTNGNTKEMPPENLKAYTIGSKNRFFDNRLQVNISAYFYDYTNKYALAGVMTIVDANGNGVRDDGENQYRTDSDARTVGDMEVYGVDLQTSTVFTDRDKMDLSVSYLDKTWTNLLFDYWEITNSLGIEDLDFSGKRATYAPEWTIQFGYSHLFDLLERGSITARFDARYQSEYRLEIPEYRQGIVSADDETIFREYQLPIITQEGHMISDFSAVYVPPSSSWKLTGYVKNITNYAVKRNIQAVVSSGVQNMMIGPPRTYGVAITIDF